MEKLWRGFWTRTLACLFGAPPIMAFCAIAAGVVINLVPGYVATFVVVVVAIHFVFAKSASLDVSRELAGISPLVVLGLTYIGAVLVTTGLAPPIIQRRKKRTATTAELSGLF